MSNFGAFDRASGHYFPTKKALKDALASRPQDVQLESTDAFGPNACLVVCAVNDENVARANGGVIVGPDPYHNRRWYAAVKVSLDGTVKVS